MKQDQERMTKLQTQVSAKANHSATAMETLIGTFFVFTAFHTFKLQAFDILNVCKKCSSSKPTCKHCGHIYDHSRTTLDMKYI